MADFVKMIKVRQADERGHGNHGWLQSRHSFSFAEYYDPDYMGFLSLRVINDDRVAPGMGFGTHPHRDMEIFSYVLEGRLAHKDSMGNSRELAPGEIQLMSAGTGVTHSEFNPSKSESLHFLQIWILPGQRGLEPAYTEWRPKPGEATSPKVLGISPDGRNGSAQIRQDAEIYRVRLERGQSVTHDIRPGRGVWLQMALGSLTVNEIALTEGDGASQTEPGHWHVTATEPAHALIFDLAKPDQ
jgi:redox-sensitive bicupin YhaK (pirin superfamily)